LHFGTAVALSADGKTLAIGAPQERSAARGVNGDQADNSEYLAGAAYVFRHDSAGWQQQAYLKASNPKTIFQFGFSLSLSADGTMLAVGSPNEDGASGGINGDEENRTPGGSGAVYVKVF